jgi:hypothetical protein
LLELFTSLLKGDSLLATALLALAGDLDFLLPLNPVVVGDPVPGLFDNCSAEEL